MSLYGYGAIEILIIIIIIIIITIIIIIILSNALHNTLITRTAQFA